MVGHLSRHKHDEAQRRCCKSSYSNKFKITKTKQKANITAVAAVFTFMTQEMLFLNSSSGTRIAKQSWKIGKSCRAIKTSGGGGGGGGEGGGRLLVTGHPSSLSS